MISCFRHRYHPFQCAHPGCRAALTATTGLERLQGLHIQEDHLDGVPIRCPVLACTHSGTQKAHLKALHEHIQMYHGGVNRSRRSRLTPPELARYRFTVDRVGRATDRLRQQCFPPSPSPLNQRQGGSATREAPPPTTNDSLESDDGFTEEDIRALLNQ